MIKNSIETSVKNVLEFDRKGINVQEYGATGNGTTDDYTAINSTITALSGSGDLYFPKATAYRIASNLTMANGIRYVPEQGAMISVDGIAISAITKANPGEVTTSSAHNFSNGDKVRFKNVGGMVELNYSTNGNVEYTVTVVNATKFTIGVNTSAYTTYTSGGYAQHILTINGTIDAGLYQIFAGNGTAAFGAGSVKEVYPQWWGAVGDGVTDNTTAMQRAVATGKNVSISAGTYNIGVNGISITNSNQRIYGEGTSSIIHQIAEGFPILALADNITDIEIDHLKLTGIGVFNDAWGGRGSIQHSSATEPVDRIKIHHCCFNHPSVCGISGDLFRESSFYCNTIVGVGEYGILIGHGARSVEIFSNYIANIHNVLGDSRGININESDNIDIHDNIIYDTDAYHIAYSFGNTTNINIHDNLLDTTSQAGGVGISAGAIASPGASSWNIHNNIIRNVSTGIWLRNADNILISNNSISNCDYGIDLQGLVGSYLINHALITNNKLFDNIIGVLASSPGVGCVIKDNLIVDENVAAASTGIKVWNSTVFDCQVSGNRVVGCDTTYNIETAQSTAWEMLGAYKALRHSRFGYGVGTYRVLQIGEVGTNIALALGVDISGNLSGAFAGNEILIPNSKAIIAPNAANNAFLGVLRVGSDDKVYLGGSDYQVLGTIVLDIANGNIGFGTASPNAKSIVDVSSTTKGFLPPRMTTTQRDAITSVPAGLMIYNTTTNKINFYNGSAWEQVTSAV